MVIIDDSVILFMDENNIKPSLKLKKIISNLELFPKMYPMIEMSSNTRHFFIEKLEFVYVIDSDIIHITDVRYATSNIKFKIN